MTLKTDIEIICLPFPEIFFMLFYLFTGSGTVAVSSFLSPHPVPVGLHQLLYSAFQTSCSKDGFSANSVDWQWVTCPSHSWPSTLAKYRSSRFSMLMLCPTGRHVVHQASRWRTLRWTCLAAPASQAYIERVFSAYGMQSHGRRNRDPPPQRWILEPLVVRDRDVRPPRGPPGSALLLCV